MLQVLARQASLRGASLTSCNRLGLLQVSGFATDPPACSVEGGSKVVELQSDAEYEAAIAKVASKNGVAVLDFTAKWCGPCKMISPVVEQLAAAYPCVPIFKLDIDNPALAATVNQHSIASVPTFVALLGGKPASAFSGADRAQLLRMVKELYSTLPK